MKRLPAMLAHEQAHGHGESFISKYIFSTDHKVIAKQFLWYGLIMMIFGGLFALMVRWQLAWPETAASPLPSFSISLIVTILFSILIFLTTVWIAARRSV